MSAPAGLPNSHATFLGRNKPAAKVYVKPPAGVAPYVEVTVPTAEGTQTMRLDYGDGSKWPETRAELLVQDKLSPEFGNFPTFLSGSDRSTDPITSVHGTTSLGRIAVVRKERPVVSVEGQEPKKGVDFIVFRNCPGMGVRKSIVSGAAWSVFVEHGLAKGTLPKEVAQLTP